MAKIKWTKEDVIKKFQEAVTPGLSKPGGQRPGVLQGLLDKVKTKIPGRLGEGEQRV
jgi:hypothetical protein